MLGLLRARVLYLRARVRDGMRRSGLAAIGGLLLLVGFGFLVAAIWHALERWNGPIFAALILTALFGAAGGIVLAMSRRSRVHRLQEELRLRDLQRRQEPPVGRVVAAFLDGMEAGINARRRPPR